MLLACDSPDAKDSVEDTSTLPSGDASDPSGNPGTTPELSVDFQPQTPAVDPNAFPPSDLRWADMGTIAADPWYVAYRVAPDLEPLGDAQGIIGAECFSQVEDGQLVIFSLDEDRWVELPLPTEEVNCGGPDVAFHTPSRKESWLTARSLMAT